MVKGIELAKKTKINANNITAVVLMAGKGTRMKSDIPKVMHDMVGRPMGWYVVKALEKAGIKNRVLVTGYKAEIVQQAFHEEKCIRQEPQLGTGHALMTALRAIPSSTTHIIVVNGDTPLLTPYSIRGIIARLSKNDCKAVIASDWMPNPNPYGRVIIDENNRFVAIREVKDLRSEEMNIEWVNVGLYAFEMKSLRKYIDKIVPQNKQKEYYITDLPGLMVKDGLNVEIYDAEDDSFMIMPNNRAEMAYAAGIILSRILNGHMGNGVTIIDPRRTYIEHDVKIGRDAIIYPDTYLFGRTVIGKGSMIGPITTITNSTIGQNVKIKQSSVEEAKIEEGCSVGPFSHIRPETHLKKGSRIGNFVEIKKSTIGEGSKVNHLSYIGDASIGRKVNIGAGTITCNYDGFKKHKTVIGDGAFIGSDSILVAPVKIGAGTLTGAGSVITRDVPPGKIVMGVPARVVEKKTKLSNK
jgi:bifunctional UDP-N-acetylglucosamine pyrophosphorylase/glucosamine-1-phosphate N-acetyltransferase